MGWLLLAGASPLACHLLSGHADLTPRDAAFGQPCTFDEDCESNFCSDEVCCAERCNQSCMACNLGADGQCEARGVGPDPNDECDGVCNGSGTCVRGGLLALATVGDGTTQHVNTLAVDAFDNVIVGGTYDGALQLGALRPPPNADKTTPFVTQYTTNGLPSGPLYSVELGAIAQVDAFSVGSTANADVVIVGSAFGAGTDFWLHVPARWSSPLTFGGRGSQNGIAARGHPAGMVVLGSFGDNGAALPALSLPGVEAGAFVALLDEAGQLLTVRGLGDDVAVGPGGIAVDANGSIYVTGRYEGPLRTGGTPLLHAPLTTGQPPGGVLGQPGDASDADWITGTGPGVFVLRLAADLTVSWATSLAGSPGVEAPPVVTPVGSERLAVAFDSVDSADQPVVIALEAADGTPLWTEQIAAAPMGLAGSEDGVVVAGSIHAPIAFAGGELRLLENTTTAIVAAFDENGGQRWGRSIAPGVARATAIDTQGHVLIGGQYSGTFDLGIGNASSTTDTDGFLAEMTADGETLWQRSLGSSEPQRIRAMLFYKGSILVAGAFDQAMSVGPSKNLSPTGDDNGFVARFTDELEPQWLFEVSGQGAQTVTALTDTDAGRIIVAVCANQEVVVGDDGGAPISVGQGTTLFELDGIGNPGQGALSIASEAPLECDAPLGLTHHAGEIFVAGHIPELAFERRAYIKRLRASSFELLEEREFQLPGPERVTGLAVDDTAVVVGGFSQPSAGANEGFIKSFTRLTLDTKAEHTFSADTVLLHELEGDRVAAVLASGSPVRIGGKEVVPQGGATNGFLAIFNTPALELVRLVGLGPMRPRALEVDDDGNLAIAGELTESVSWEGGALLVDGVDSFVLKLAPTGERLTWEHVTGTGNESLTAIARGLDGRVHAGGIFDGSLVVGDMPPRFGSGLDGVLLSIGR